MKGRSLLRLDPIACDGRSLCAEALPELITLDDWGFPLIAADGVPKSLESAAREAVRVCPKLALRLERPHGPAAPEKRTMVAC